MITRKIASIIVVALCLAAATTAVLAQGRYANVYSRGDIDGFIRNLETTSDIFSRDFKNTGGISSTERRNVDRFENAVDRLRSRFNGSSNNWWQSRTEVQGMMNEARQVNVMMNNERYARPLESQWRNLRRDINKLADTYELLGLPGGNGSGGGYPGGGSGGGGQSRPPSWAVGTWYWQQGPDRQFSIDANGRVTEYTGGRTSYGSFNRGTIFLNGNQSTITRTAAGVQTYNTATGETSDYARSAYGGGYPPVGGGGGGQSRPPSWAVGTWHWQQGPDRQFSIDANGRVTEYAGGRTSYGTFNRGTIFLNGNQSTITRTAAGVQTYNTATGETSDYSRSAYGGGGGYPPIGGGGGNMSRPPSWALGAWTWVQGSGRQFTIEANGRIVEYTGGRTNYGSFYNGVMSLNGSTSTVTQTRNGIRTYNQSTGETSDYVRQ